MKFILIVLLWISFAEAQTKQSKETKPLPNLAETIEWLTGASQEEAGWGAGGFQFSGDGKCNAEISTIEILSNAKPERGIRRYRYAFRLVDIDPADIRIVPVKATTSYNVIEFHTYNYKDSITFTAYKDAVAGWSEKEVEFTKMVPVPVTSSLRTNEWFAPRFVKAFKRAVELCGGKKSSYN